MFLQKSILTIFLAVSLVLAPISVFAVENYEVTTYSPTNTCQSGATLNGYVNPFFTNDTTRWFEWGVSPDQLSNLTASTRNGNNTEYFQQDIRNLALNTTYYFRVVAQNSKGTGRGKVLSFQTEGSAACKTSVSVPVYSANTSVSGTSNTNTSGSNTSVVYVSQSVITKRATDISNTSAKLNAVALPTGSAQTYGWFEWGSTPDFGKSTTRKYIGTSPSMVWEEDVFGLVPGTTYFFKPVIENQNGRTEGVLFSFRTTGTAPFVPTPVPSTSNQTAGAIQAVKNTAPVKTAPKSGVATTPPLSVGDKKTIGVEVIPSSETAAPKERINQTIQFENTTGTTLKNVAVRAVLPCNIEYTPSVGGDTFLQTGQMLTHEVGDVKPGQKISLTLGTTVGANVPDKTPIETIAVVNWQSATPASYTQSVGRAVVTVDTNKKIAKESTAVAGVGSVKSAYSIFPASLKDWGSVIGLLFLLFAAYMVFLVKRRNDGLENEEVLETVPVLATAPVTHRNLTAVGVPERKYSTKDPFVTEENRQKKTLSSAMPVGSVRKLATEKAAPPDNLPV
jgi:hypothetical protein